MKKVYEAWEDGNGCNVLLAPQANIPEQRACGALSANARLLYNIEADTFEEALAVHHIRMGWSPYVPMGEAQACPRGCGAMFYPEGSGDCPNCGDIC